MKLAYVFVALFVLWGQGFASNSMISGNIAAGGTLKEFFAKNN